jgi:hypothetical protein
VAIQGRTLDAFIPNHVADDCAAADHLGLVLVHGVGSQNPGETLLSWSDRLIRMLASLPGLDDFTPPDLVFRSTIDLQGERQSTIELRIPPEESRPRAQHWLLTEAYWAASIQPPSVPTMLAWLGARGAAGLLARGFAATKRLRNIVYLTGIVIGVLVLYAAIRAVTSILPIAAVRNAFVAPLDRLLTGWLGDMEVLLVDPAQSANVRTSVREAMQAVAAAGFPSMAVVAHSGGAVASYMTLTDTLPWAPRAESDKIPAIRCYITLGQGLNAAWRLAGVGDGASCSLATGSGRRLTVNVRINNTQLRWYDYHSEGDTVSEASVSPPDCLLDAGPSPADEQSIENKPSNPHGTYWDNDEEFLLPVVQRLLASARTDQPAEQAASAFPAPDPTWHARRLLRIGMFSLTSRLLFSAMITAIVASALFGGGRLSDLGNWVAALVSGIPGNEIATGAVGWLRDASSAGGLNWARTIGTFLITSLLVLAAIYPIVKLGPAKLASETSQNRLFNALVRAVDFGAGILPLVPLAAWARDVLPEPNPTNAPPWAVFSGLALVFISIAVAFVAFSRQDPQRPHLPGWKVPSRWSGVAAAGMLAILTVAAFSVAIAIAGDAPFGGTSLGVMGIGSVVAWLLFKLLSRVANWRWDAWDEQEREQFRQSKGGDEPDAQGRRPYGRRVDLLAIGLVGVAAMTLAVAIGGPFVPPNVVPQAFGVVVGIVLLIGLVGAGQDAANSRAGVRPRVMSPLPSSSA